MDDFDIMTALDQIENHLPDQIGAVVAVAIAPRPDGLVELVAEDCN
jgi:hypothetical protein